MSFYCVSIPYQTDATGYYAVLADLPWAVWLDSGGMARYDILTAAPYQTMALQSNDVRTDPFEWLRAELGNPASSIANIPFAGGALGYWSYDLSRCLVSLPNSSFDTECLPDMAVGLYDWALVVDHHLCRASLVSHQRYVETIALLPKILLRLQSKQTLLADTFRVQGNVTSNFTVERYAQAFEQVQQYLQAGDCYQINLAQRFSAQAEGDAFAAYLKLRELSPAPYSAFLNLPYAQILCASPERFLRVENCIVETKPIKGTRPRGCDAQQDKQFADELRRHPKDRAENLMIVDLLRSDLGKSCVTGSVRTPKLFEIESFANVHHLVSTVTGQLAAGRDALDVLRDCFPGGSITGAPKQRAMQIIEQLEPHRRGVYCGALGYVGFDGNMDTNIAIRTMVYSNREIHCWAGGGIVADSICANEYQETFDKASIMLKVLNQYGGNLNP